MTSPTVKQSALDENLAFWSNAHQPAIRLAAHALSSHSGHLDVETKPDTDTLTLCAQAGLFGAQLLIVRGSQQCIQGMAVCAGIIGRTGGGWVVARLLGDHVSASRVNGV